MTDKHNRTRVAHRLVAEFRPASATGSGGWRPYWDAEVQSVTLNAGPTPNTAEILFPRLRWSDAVGIDWGSQVRIRTAVPTRRNGQPRYARLQPAVLFQGFCVRRLAAFDGGGPNRQGFEKSLILCADYRWYINSTLSIYGQYARTAPDTAASFTFFSGRRCIFNEKGKPNRDATPYASADGDYHLFGDDAYWTARQMLSTILLETAVRTHITAISGLDNARGRIDLAAAPHHVIIDTMGALEAIFRILGPLGWSLREEYTIDGPVWTFFKTGRAQYYTRDAEAPTILHELYAPAAGELIPAAVAAGKKMLAAARLEEDITAVISAPVGIGAPERYEATFSLVPAWDDADLTPPDAANSYEGVFVTEADLQASTNPDGYDFYKYYHPKGSQFKRHVGRKWALNEAGDYPSRGGSYAFETVIPAALDADGVINYGPFRRRFLNCLTFDESNINSVGIRVELSLDGGTTWQALEGSIRNLEGECGIYIEDLNLSEILDKTARTISGGSLDGFELNYWTSLCRDKLAQDADDINNRWPNWQTRVRVTASVQLDQRLRHAAVPTANAGSPFAQTKVYDFADEYTYQLRTASSGFYSSGLSSWDTDESAKLKSRVTALRDANEDKSIAGPLVLDRLWLGDGSGTPEIQVGDSVRGIAGRWYDLGGSVRQDRVYPEIVQIVYDPQTQRQTLVTRDARFAAIRLQQ